jgi:hypothetical protein
MEKHNGWVSLHRKILQSPIFNKPPEYFKVWIYLLLNVDHQNGIGFFSWNNIKNDCHVTNSQLKKCFIFMEKEQMISRKKLPRGVEITILNWDKYQHTQNERPTERPTMRPTKRPTETTNEISNNADNQGRENLKETNYETNKETKNETTHNTINKISTISKEKDINNIRNSDFSNSSLKDEKDLKDITPLLSAPPSKLAKSQPIMFNEQTLKLENIPIEKLNKWKETFNCDVDIEIKKMEVWLSANPERRKKNYEKFIYNWLSKASEKSSNAKTQAKPEQKKEAGYGYF